MNGERLAEYCWVDLHQRGQDTTYLLILLMSHLAHRRESLLDEGLQVLAPARLSLPLILKDHT